MRCSIENICCLITPTTPIFIVASVFGRCLFDKQTNELKSGKLTVYKCFSNGG